MMSRDTHTKSRTVVVRRKHLHNDADELGHALDDEQHEEHHQQKLVKPEGHDRQAPSVGG